jgi:hypothetical protein
VPPRSYKKGDFMRKKFNVTLVRGTSRKTITVYGLSADHTRYEALKANPGWEIFDLRE